MLLPEGTFTLHDTSAYPAPVGYPSPFMSGMPAPSAQQYSSYPPLPDGQGQPNAPAGSNVQPLSLPPIRGGEGGPQAQQQSQQQPLPQPGQMPQYYIAPGPMPFPMDMRSGEVNPNLRYPIPPAESRIMSGGRHKKEIKRRTKTGCLTCRKRRIKCDEQHPACRNCQKSKRECLGYDPIFKPQPGPPPLQPAVDGRPMHASLQNPPPYTQGYAAHYPGYPPHPTASENSTSEANDYSAAIDPALGGEMAQSGDGGEQFGHRAKRTKIEDLLCINGFAPPPPAPSQPIPDTLQHEIKTIWATVYAPGIDKFLETKWFISQGQTHLLASQTLCDQFATLIHRFQTDPRIEPNYTFHLAATYSLEAKMVWQMIGMCRDVANAGKAQEGQEHRVSEDDVQAGVHDAVKRMDTFEALVTGEYLSTDSAPPSTNEKAKSNGSALEHQQKSREMEFWSLVHTFLTIRDDEASSAREIDNTISNARGLLDSRENRDVIYSIMVARHVGARMAEFPANMEQPSSNEEADNKNKLFVAKKFIEEEANGKGTNQIVQRLCGMAARSWGQRR